MRRAALLAFVLIGCGEKPPTAWDRQIAAVRAGASDAVVVEAGAVRPDDLRDLREGCGLLRRLTLRRATPGPAVCVGDDFTAALAGAAGHLPNLERLDCGGPVRVAALAPHLPPLVHLNLPAAAAGGGDLIALAEAQPRLELLRLHAPGLTDADAAALGGFGHLRFLHLLAAPLTDAAVPHLAALPRLESLYLDGSRLTAHGWAELHRLRPDLHLHADDRHPAGGH